jgi:hypothetical protein
MADRQHATGLPRSRLVNAGALERPDFTVHRLAARDVLTRYRTVFGHRRHSMCRKPWNLLRSNLVFGLHSPPRSSSKRCVSRKSCGAIERGEISMKRLVAAGLLSVMGIALSGTWTISEARQRSGFALLDQTLTGGDLSVQCGARRGVGQGQASASFTYFVTVTNAAATAGTVEVLYGTGSTSVKYPIAAGAVLSFSGAAGSGADDNLITVRGADTAELVGSLSALVDPGARPPVGETTYCKTN